LLLVEQGSGAVDKASELEFRITPNAIAVKAGKQCRGGSSIKALVVIENANSQCIPHSSRIPAPPLRQNQPAGEKLIGLTA